jgi:hypothetical protein
MPDIFLRVGEANPADIRLWDGTAGGPDNRDVILIITGGGTTGTTGRKGALQTVTIAGGGLVGLATAKRALYNAVVAGGGVLAISGASGRLYSLVATGGGIVVVDASSALTPPMHGAGGGGRTFGYERLIEQTEAMVADHNDRVIALRWPS